MPVFCYALFLAVATALAILLSSALATNAGETSMTTSKHFLQTRSNSNNILQALPQASPDTDYTDILNLNLKSSKTVYLPYTGSSYLIRSSLIFGNDATLICERGVKIRTSALKGPVITAANANSRLLGCLFDGAGVAGVRLATISGSNFLWDGLGYGGALNAGRIVVNGSNVTIRNSRFVGGKDTAIELQNAAHPQILDNEFENNVGFGITANNGSSDGLIKGNWTNRNGLELFGGTYQSYRFEVVNNRAESTGDNCFSVSGSDYLIAENTGIGCKGNGLGLYGSRNIATANIFRNNAQGNGANASWNAGINVTPGFGGAGQYNKVYCNTLDDDQPYPTQKFGIMIMPSAQYRPWTSGTQVAINKYVTSGNNIYKSSAGGTTGSTAPTHSSGTAQDGTVIWTYLSSFANSATADFNVINANVFKRFSAAAYKDATGTAHNCGPSCQTLRTVNRASSGGSCPPAQEHKPSPPEAD